MTTATINHATALHILHRADQAGPDRTAAALRFVGGAAGVESYRTHARISGLDWMRTNADWREWGLAGAVKSAERQMGRALDGAEHGLLTAAFQDAIPAF